MAWQYWIAGTHTTTIVGGENDGQVLTGDVIGAGKFNEADLRLIGWKGSAAYAAGFEGPGGPEGYGMGGENGASSFKGKFYGRDFEDFLNTRGYISVVGIQYPLGHQQFYTRAGQRPVGIGITWSLAADEANAPFAIGMAVAGAFIGNVGGIAYAAGSQTVSAVNSVGNNGLTIQSGIAIAKGSSGLMDDFDYGSFFDPVDYSSGEGFTAFSDASNVDFGFDDAGSFGLASTGDLSDLPVDASDYSHEGANYGGTAESSVSDYGSTSQGNPAFDNTDKIAGLAAKAAPVAAKPGTATTPLPVSTPTGGGAKYSQAAPSIASVLTGGAGGSAGAAPAASAGGLGSLLTQLESSLPKSYTGQLGANKAAPGNTGISPMLLIGGALLIAAVVLHKV